MDKNEGKYPPDYFAGSDDADAMPTPNEEVQERIEEMEERTRRLEDKFNHLSHFAATAFYALGTSIAVVLSWSRNASILWCILHGILSWIYVIYSAITR
jgi:hypothetical protein